MTVPTFTTTSRGGNDDSDDEASTSTSASGVILAFPDGRVIERTDASTSKLGGSPRFWPCASTAPVRAVAHCRLCGEPMPLVVQVYAPLDDPALDLQREERHRALYVWSCRRKDCRSKSASVRAFRASRWDQRLADDWAASRRAEDEERERQEAARRAAAAPANPFAAAASPFGNPFAGAGGLGDSIFGGAASTKPAAPSAPIVQPESRPPPPSAAPVEAEWDDESTVQLPATYLATGYEPSASDPSGSSIASGLSALDLQNDGSEGKHREGKGQRASASSSSEGGGWAGEAYEVQRLPGLSDEFERFQQRVGRAGAEGQVLRYDRGGSALPYGPSSTSTAPACEACGSKRTFEAQVMPQAIALLDQGETDPALECGWSTIHVYTCAADCVERGGRGEVWREEAVIVEFEET